MAKFVYVSILLASMALPMRAARDPSPTRGLRRAVLSVIAFHVLYLVVVLYVLPRL